MIFKKWLAKHYYGLSFEKVQAIENAKLESFYSESLKLAKIKGIEDARKLYS